MSEFFDGISLSLFGAAEDDLPEPSVELDEELARVLVVHLVNFVLSRLREECEELVAVLEAFVAEPKLLSFEQVADVFVRTDDCLGVVDFAEQRDLYFRGGFGFDAFDL